MLKSRFIVALTLGLAFGAPALAQDLTSPAGQWTTIDDESGKPKSIVQIDVANDQLTGKVVEVLWSERGPHPVCEKCEGDRKDKPVEGMTIIWDMKKSGDGWEGGTILDPKSGKTYGCKIHLIEGGQKLEVRGFKGISLLGRTQTWVRKAATP
jgi:uncharacterized protein (DUF2147 family)